MSKKCLKIECNAWSMQDGFCFSHSPNNFEKRTMAQRKGGSIGKSIKDRITVKLVPVNVQSSHDVLTLLSQTIDHVRLGQMDIKVANCVGNLSNYLIRAIELSSIEERIRAIEESLLEGKL